MKQLIVALLLLQGPAGYAWGFYGHQQINYFSVFLLPPEMILFFKPEIGFLKEHSVDPDKRRYAIPQEAPRHYIDMDRYGIPPFDNLPRRWKDAIERFGEDSLNAHGIVPWWIEKMLQRLTQAFKEKNRQAILKLSAELGHYIADAHVPLHACSNHNGQYTNQKGIHGFWESRIPELLAEKEWDFYIGKAAYVKEPGGFIWARVFESAAASDTVLRVEREITALFRPDEKYAFEPRNDMIIRQYSTAFTIACNEALNGMVERRMRQSIYAVASYWYTAWINAGQPDLSTLNNEKREEEQKEFDELNEYWKKQGYPANCLIFPSNTRTEPEIHTFASLKQNK